ncbi:ABC transporter ATP-binding protein [Paracoccus aminophilus]|uniref:Iron complex transport system ATP-binding protein n=1 Tax=Paracoccus aminophilus JCM 7686 TaxID=1367847 RepID=S5Y0R1_PARAH|nr:ATP-binding cassette domain-containing protein [Paracoccus aminophilus]AGT11077.1 iron complex transport system ATP-binding protein [Paracoccus aminophilus JCM 7686]
MTLYSLTDVSFQLPERKLLTDLTLDLPAGKVVGLIGHNGSGKSTLLKLLARQLRPSAGGISFEGRALRDWPGRDFARRIAYLPQDPPPATGLTVRDLVAMGRYPWHGALGRMKAEDHDRIDEAMTLTDVAAFATRQVQSLSGGERQRVWLAMLVAQEAGAFLLDEPISALDISHQVEVLSLVRKLSEDGGASVIVVLHDINMAARYCDEIIALKGGRLIARGDAQTLLARDTLREIYGVEIATFAHPRSGAPIAYLD